MVAFWNGMNVLQKVYFCIGLAATLVLILQIITMLFGVGENTTDIDLDGDGEPDVSIDTSDGFTLFSVRGVVAFFAIGGWVGYIFADKNTALAIVLSVVTGFLALVGMAFIMRGIMKMRSDGNINIEKAIGKTADVSDNPRQRRGRGKNNYDARRTFCGTERDTKRRYSAAYRHKSESNLGKRRHARRGKI